MDHRQLATNSRRAALKTRDEELKALLVVMADFWEELAQRGSEHTAYIEKAKAA